MPSKQDAVSFYMTGTLVSLVLHSAERYSYRFVRSIRNSYAVRHAGDAQKTMIIGAGDAARSLIREIVSSEHVTRYRVVCVIDDDPGKACVAYNSNTCRTEGGVPRSRKKEQQGSLPPSVLRF